MLAANATDIGNIVRRRRARASLSQTELAEKIGVSRKWIADLERGHPRAQLQLVLDVLDALNAIVDVTDAPSDQRTSGTQAKFVLARAADQRTSRGVRQGSAALGEADDYWPRIAVQPELSRALALVAESAQRQPEIQRAIDAVRRLNTINPEQLAAIRNAISHIQLNEDAREAIRRASKDLTRAEAYGSGASRRRGGIDDDGDDK